LKEKCKASRLKATNAVFPSPLKARNDETILHEQIDDKFLLFVIASVEANAPINIVQVLARVF
jgi:hypothetical protein